VHQPEGPATQQLTLGPLGDYANCPKYKVIDIPEKDMIEQVDISYNANGVTKLVFRDKNFKIIEGELGKSLKNDKTATIQFSPEKQLAGLWGYKTALKIDAFGAVFYDTTCDPQATAPDPSELVEIKTVEVEKTKLSTGRFAGVLVASITIIGLILCTCIVFGTCKLLAKHRIKQLEITKKDLEPGQRAEPVEQASECWKDVENQEDVERTCMDGDTSIVQVMPKQVCET
jgi:hypothetical protein